MSRAPRSESRETEGRRKRVPLGVTRSKLAVSGRDPNYQYRWVNEQTHNDPDRLNSALQGGYEYVQRAGVTVGEEAADGNSDTGSQVSRIVGTKPDGSPLRAYLMRIPKEFYAEDQQAKQAEIDQTETAIKRGKQTGAPDTAYTKDSNKIAFGR